MGFYFSLSLSNLNHLIESKCYIANRDANKGSKEYNLSHIAIDKGVEKMFTFH